MDWHQIVRTHLPRITGDAARDEDIIEELAQHLALRFEEARRAGSPVHEAHAAVLEELRNGPALRRAMPTRTGTVRAHPSRRLRARSSSPASGATGVMPCGWLGGPPDSPRPRC